MMKLVLGLLFTLTVQSVFAQSQYNSLHFYELGRWDFTTGIDFMKTEHNYEVDGGSFEKLQNSHYYQTTNFDLGARWNAISNAAFYTQLKMTMAESEDFNIIRTNSGLNELKIGSDFLLTEAYFDIIPEIYFIYPFARVDKSADDVLLGEGAMELTAKLWVQKNWSSIFAYAMGGLTYRDEGRAMLLPYSVGLEWDNSILDIGGEVGGFFRLNNDDETDNRIIRTAVTNKVNGGSLKYYSVNPSLLEAKVWLNMDFSQEFSLRGGLAQTLNGESSAAGMTFFALLTYGFNPNSNPTKIKSANEVTGTPQEMPNSEFVPDDSSQVDQSAFQPPAAKTEKQIQQELDNAEMQIELKKQKTKKKKK